jgi:MtN3 and saliva related transmembrane protein
VSETVGEAIGWISSLILLMTIGKQVYKQWQEGNSEGVSKWLFVGQIAASVGFTAYSVYTKNWVFIVTNSLMVINAILGVAILFYHRRAKEFGKNAKPETQK